MAFPVYLLFSLGSHLCYLPPCCRRCWIITTVMLNAHLCRGSFQLLLGPAPEAVTAEAVEKQSSETLGREKGLSQKPGGRRIAGAQQRQSEGSCNSTQQSSISAFTTLETLLCADSSAVKPPLGFLPCCVLCCALQELFAISNACVGWQWQGGESREAAVEGACPMVCPCFPRKGIISAMSEETRGGHRLMLCSLGP